VVEVGEDVTTIKVGDWVIIPWVVADGHLDLTPPSILTELFFGFGPEFGKLAGLQGTSPALARLP
jgi:hypothetical protein